MQELKALDGVAQEFDRRERGEVEECPADEMEAEIKADYEVGIRIFFHEVLLAEFLCFISGLSQVGIMV